MDKPKLKNNNNNKKTKINLKKVYIGLETAGLFKPCGCFFFPGLKEATKRRTVLLWQKEVLL